MASNNVLIGSGKPVVERVEREVLHKPYPKMVYHKAKDPIIVADADAFEVAKKNGYDTHEKIFAKKV